MGIAIALLSFKVVLKRNFKPKTKFILLAFWIEAVVLTLTTLITHIITQIQAAERFPWQRLENAYWISNNSSFTMWMIGNWVVEFLLVRKDIPSFSQTNLIYVNSSSFFVYRGGADSARLS